MGKRNLLEALRAQQTVAGSVPLARRLLNNGTLAEYSPGKTIAAQGGADNAMYMILSGSVGVLINRREIAVRRSGTHVGEMALLDPTARRSATLITKERTLLFELSEAAITRIARAVPDLWRRLAVELATRLRERSRFIREPNVLPDVFIGSSSEAVAEATCVQRALLRRPLTCKLWTEGVFQLSSTTMESLTRAARQCDFAVLFLTPDDMTSSRGRQKASPRDNVVFELGLFMGALGRDRTYVVMPRGADLKLPTDLLGLTLAPYAAGPAHSIGKRLRPVTRVLWRRMSDLGAR